MKKQLLFLLLPLLFIGNVNAQTLYGLYPWDDTDNVVSFVYNEATDSWEYDAIAGSTGLGVNFGFDMNPADGQYYLIGYPGDWPPVERNLYRIDNETFAQVEFITTLVSSDGNDRPQDFAINSNGEFFIVYQNGTIDQFDLNTLTATPYATVGSDHGAVGITYDWDMDRLLYAHNRDPIELYEITSGGTVNHLFDFNTPGPNSGGSAQAITYAGNGMCYSSSTFSWDGLYSIDLDDQTATLLLQPTDSPWDNYKNLLYPDRPDTTDPAPVPLSNIALYLGFALIGGFVFFRIYRIS